VPTRLQHSGQRSHRGATDSNQVIVHIGHRFAQELSCKGWVVFNFRRVAAV
jgi:hypothetical protein